MRLIPLVVAFLFRHGCTLIKLHVAFEAHGCDTVVMGLETPTFAVAQLVGVSGNDCTITGSADLTRASSYCF